MCQNRQGTTGQGPVAYSLRSPPPNFEHAEIPRIDNGFVEQTTIQRMVEFLAFKRLATYFLAGYLAVAPFQAQASERQQTLRLPSGIELRIVTDESLVGKEYCSTWNEQRWRRGFSIPDECEFYDPNNSGNPLVEVRVEDLDKKISEHFTMGDFARIGKEKEVKYARKGDVHKVGEEYYYKYIRIEPDLIRRVEELMRRTGVKPKIDDWYRSFGYNARMYWALGKKPTSSHHCSGDAVDIHVPHAKTMKVVKELFENDGIGFGSNFYHLDTRGKKARWYYHLGKRKK